MLGDNKLILTRNLGFSKVMPGADEWQLRSQEKNACWVCDKWVQTVVFWSRPFACKQSLPTNLEKPLQEKLDQKVRQIEMSTEAKSPVFSSSHNDWRQPIPMMNVLEFADRVDKQKPEYF